MRFLRLGSILKKEAYLDHSLGGRISKQHGTHLARGRHSCLTPRHTNEHKHKKYLRGEIERRGTVKARLLFCNCLVLAE